MRATALAKMTRKQPELISGPGWIPSPTGGWDAISPLPAMPPDRAVVLDNFIARPGWVEPRRGFNIHCANVGNDTLDVNTVMAYNGFGSVNKLFAVADTTIYDVTDEGVAVATSVTALTTSRMQHTMFSNSSGTQYLIAVNGQDNPKIFNGSVWADTSITGSGINQSNFVQVAAHKGRLWFIEVNSTAPCFMAVGAISGTATAFELGPFMTRGGFVMAIGTWTVDTRQTVNEYIAFITSRGQIIVYQGSDPTDPNDWLLVGVYNVGPPIGRRCFLRIAGNLIIISIDGLLPMTEMLSTDRAASNRVSISGNIMNAMAQASQLYRDNFGWQFIEYPKGTIAILNIPVSENQEAMQFVMNTLTGAWSRFTGINANCWETDVDDNIFFGGDNGIVYKWDVGASDYITPITCDVKTAFSNMGNAAFIKRVPMIQPIIVSSGAVNPAIGINVDFRDDAELATPSAVVPFTALWNEVNWNQFNWPTSQLQSPTWISTTAIGHWFSIAMRVVTGLEQTNAAEWDVGLWDVGDWASPISTQVVTLQVNGWNMVYEQGAYV